MGKASRIHSQSAVMAAQWESPMAMWSILTRWNNCTCCGCLKVPFVPCPVAADIIPPPHVHSDPSSSTTPEVLAPAASSRGAASTSSSGATSLGSMKLREPQ